MCDFDSYNSDFIELNWMFVALKPTRYFSDFSVASTEQKKGFSHGRNYGRKTIFTVMSDGLAIVSAAVNSKFLSYGRNKVMQMIVCSLHYGWECSSLNSSSLSGMQMFL